jgi:tRNA(Ile)-lysidine synthetase-like protein
MTSSGKIEIDDLNMLMQYGEISPKRAIRKIQKNGFKINIDSERISLPLTFRGLNAGDRFSPLGMTGTKKVGDYLTDCKTPRVLRDEIPVVTDRNGIVWLVGYQISDRVKVDKSTKKVLQIEVFKRKAGRKAKV